MVSKPGAEHAESIRDSLVCLKCGYSLRGLGGDVVTCPECGERNNAAEMAAGQWNRRWYEVPLFHELKTPCTWAIASSIVAFLVFLLLCTAVPQSGGGASGGGGDLLTVAEQTDYHKTARYAEVIDLLDRIEAQSQIMRRGELGVTSEGRSIPLVILANPPVATAEQAKTSGKAIVFAFGNIHAGEVRGKEALLMLTRELALQRNHPLFADLIITAILGHAEYTTERAGNAPTAFGTLTRLVAEQAVPTPSTFIHWRALSLLASKARTASQTNGSMSRMRLAHSPRTSTPPASK